MIDNIELKDVEEELSKIFNKIKDKTVIVEGKRDREVLYSFGFTKIITINHGLYETAEKCAGKETVILTDYDREGRTIAKRLTLFLQQLDCKIDFVNRTRIGLMFSKLKIKTIEELKSLR